MLVTILGGVGAVLVLGFLLLAFLLIVGGIVYAVMKKSKESGVVFKDGISNEEAQLVLKAANEVLQADKTKEVLAKFSSALSRASAPTKPPVV
jgi:hypothetical protein